ncbi:MAG TPA: MBL fold metallo-hydrolase [Casimicrobiaceae bacterium]|nr:MBL fold metallo-hydrolase [Casimicrobiaceae bacterium]
MSLSTVNCQLSTEGIWRLTMPLPFALDHINLWLIEDGEGFTLVDTGYGDEATRTIWREVENTMLATRPLRRIIVTHYHPDHAGNAQWLAQRFDVPVAMSAGEYLTGHAVLAQAAGYGVEDSCALFMAHGVDGDYLDAMRQRGNRYRAGVPEFPSRHRRIYPNDAIAIGGRRWHVIPGYGHSPDHVALHDPQGRVLISGDMLLPRISTNVSVWPSDPESDALGRFLDSLRAFEPLPDDTLVLPSHGEPFRGPRARVTQLREHHAARLAELLDAVHGNDAPMSAAELVPILFKRKLDVQQRFFAVGEAIAHLNHLVAQRKLERRLEGGSIRFAPWS